MWKYPDNTFKTSAPATVIHNGYHRSFTDLTREARDRLGYNEAIPIRRAPFTIYETRWTIGDDRIYREEIITATEDTAAREEHLAAGARKQRDILLRASDWTQLSDSVLDDDATVLWQSYRQALRDVPQQAGFPENVEWPEAPAME